MKIGQEIFYSSIAKYYNQVFPLNEKQLKFVKSNLQTFVNKKILDIGCSTGQLAQKLASKGCQVTGIDLNQDMIDIANNDIQVPGLNFMQANMLELESIFSKNSQDTILCFGNTLVHLDSIEEIALFFTSAAKLLKPGSKLLLQILNYDLILDERITELPLIDGPKVSFIRKYDLPEQAGDKITFNTELVIKSSRESLFHASRLLPLRKKELHQLLEHCGFGRIRYFANFDKNTYDNNHLPLVVSAERSSS